jgi:site-specific recombinase XerD
MDMCHIRYFVALSEVQHFTRAARHCGVSQPTLSNAIAERLSERTVANVVKAAARRVGLNAADFSGHSLRSDFLTSAAARGASIFKMMDVSRHKSMDTLRGYVRDADLFRDHAGAGLL